MKQIKIIVLVAMCAAMLIGAQLALSAISGVEIVTLLLLCFCFSYGVKVGVATATVFSLLRCFIFGFQINVIIVYLIYYNLFAIFFGWLGKRSPDKISLLRTVIVVVSAMLFTVCFTLIDDVITPLIFGYSANAAKVYFLASLYALIPQTLCTLITVSLLFDPLTKVMSKMKF